jgi:hypothetical protein
MIRLLIRDIYNRLSNTFDFYILKDDAHPVYYIQKMMRSNGGFVQYNR